MPLHLESILSSKDENDKKRESEVLTAILQKDIYVNDLVFATKDGAKVILTKNLINELNNKIIGKIVFTLSSNKEEKTLEVLDVDITLSNDNPVELCFDELLDGSSDANEYYEVYTPYDIHFQIETVNRYTVEDESLLDKTKSVFLSAFPFKLDIYNNIDEYNEKTGLKDINVEECLKDIDIKDLSSYTIGFSEEFAAPGYAIKDCKDICSFVIGKVISFEDVNVKFGDILCPFVIIKISTAFGIIPIAASRKCFDLTNLSVDKIIVMLADIKADFIN